MLTLEGELISIQSPCNLHAISTPYLPARISLLRRVGLPGQTHGMDFCGCRLVKASLLKSCGDQDAPELGDHAGGGGLGLGAVPGGVEAAGCDITGVVPGCGVPDGV